MVTQPRVRTDKPAAAPPPAEHQAWSIPGAAALVIALPALIVLTKRRKISVRLRNLETAQAKVNDADGNPIEIAAVVVWQVQDTAKAIYAVDDYTKFVAIQTETAVRHIASSYPYTSHWEGELSLRENVEEITGQLSAEIADRVDRLG
jgi:regulator of protease activity HflC (stomatin/prohibitin superfamily)